MKILYVASQTAASETLLLEKEISAVQRQVAEVTLQRAEVVFLPDLTIDNLSNELDTYRPDILHISVHGTQEGLWFAKDAETRTPVQLLPEDLFNLLNPDTLPKLVFVNACASAGVAAYLASRGIPAIGTTAPITNDTSISAARQLYSKLLGGQSLQTAFNTVDSLVRTRSEGTVEVSLCMPEGVEAASLVLYRVPRLVARLSAGTIVKSGKAVEIELGVTGCPRETAQVVFFTNDSSFLSKDGSLEDDLCEVIWDNPRRDEIWTEFVWKPTGNFRAAACGMTASGQTFSVSEMVVTALQHYARVANASDSYVESLAVAVRCLTEGDGAGLLGWDAERKAAEERRATKTKRKKKVADRSHP